MVMDSAAPADGKTNTVHAEVDFDRIKALQFDDYGADHKTDHAIKRDRWNTKVDFILACVGFSIGFGNVWRFPYLVYKNGGGAFFIPFFISVVLGGVPVFFLEVIMGQFMSSGGVRIWNMVPLLTGIGVGCAIILFFLNCYYNILLTWSFYYLFASFTTGDLPWAHCGKEWNTDFCSETPVIYNNSLPNPELENCFTGSVTNTTYCGKTNLTNLVDPTVEFWERKVLALSDGIDEPGYIKWDLLLCLLFAWLVVFVCICKGIKTSGKVMYVTATTPYLFMLILLIKGMTLEGAGQGVIYYLKPNMSRLADTGVWVDAGTQVFFSYSISLGTLPALGSYNPWHHNSFRDSMIFAGIDSFTCILAGFVVFPILGHMAHVRGMNVSDVVESGPGLAFIAYPKAVTLLPAAPFWSILFFIMLILLGLDSQFVGVEGFVTAITDYFPTIEHNPRKRAGFFGVCILVKFLIGLSMICQGGMYVFQIFDYYTGSRIILLVAMAECLAIGWVYGADRFYENMHMMFGYKPNGILKYMWKYVAPAYTLMIFVLNIIKYSELDYKRRPNLTYTFPTWAIIVGWMLASLAVLAIPIVAGIRLYYCELQGSWMDKVRHLMKPVLKPYQVAPSLLPEDYVLDTSDMHEPEQAVLMSDQDPTDDKTKPNDANDTLPA